MDTSNDSSPKRSGTLVFDLKCQLLYSNYDGRVLYIGEGSGAPQASPDIAFDVKRLCFRLKKLAGTAILSTSARQRERRKAGTAELPPAGAISGRWRGPARILVSCGGNV